MVVKTWLWVKWKLRCGEFRHEDDTDYLYCLSVIVMKAWKVEIQGEGLTCLTMKGVAAISLSGLMLKNLKDVKNLKYTDHVVYISSLTPLYKTYSTLPSLPIFARNSSKMTT